MFSYIWPIALVIIANTVYQICARETPAAIDPLASVTVTYIVAAVTSAVLYTVLHRGGNLFREFAQLNWAPVLLGVVLVGLEAGFIYAYKAGWQVSAASLVQSAFVSVALIFVGRFLYQEAITANKFIGVSICLVGLYFINR